MNLGVATFLALAIELVAGSTRSAHPEARDAGPDTGGCLPELPADRVELVPGPSVSPLSSFTTAQLCWVWRISSVRLQVRTARSEAQRLARLRERCLIELHQRDPEAFRRWILTARAADNPAPFFRGRLEPGVA